MNSKIVLKDEYIVLNCLVRYLNIFLISYLLYQNAAKFRAFRRTVWDSKFYYIGYFRIFCTPVCSQTVDTWSVTMQMATTDRSMPWAVEVAHHIFYCIFFVVLFCFVLNCSLLYCTVLYSPYCTILYGPELYCNVQYCTIYSL